MHLKTHQIVRIPMLSLQRPVSLPRIRITHSFAPEVCEKSLILGKSRATVQKGGRLLRLSNPAPPSPGTAVDLWALVLNLLKVLRLSDALSHDPFAARETACGNDARNTQSHIEKLCTKLISSHELSNDDTLKSNQEIHDLLERTD